MSNSSTTRWYNLACVQQMRLKACLFPALRRGDLVKVVSTQNILNSRLICATDAVNYYTCREFVCYYGGLTYFNRRSRNTDHYPKGMSTNLIRFIKWELGISVLFGDKTMHWNHDQDELLQTAVTSLPLATATVWVQLSAAGRNNTPAVLCRRLF